MHAMREPQAVQAYHQHIASKQKRLRSACCQGDIAEVQQLLQQQHSRWKGALQAIGGAWLLRCLGVQPDWAAPARLDFVYEDDDANLPLHYIAFGTPAGLLSRWRLLAPFYGGRPSTHSKERAALLHWLLHTGFLADLGLVNRRLETPLHCALRSHSIHVTQVLLTAPGVTIALATSPDIQGTTPLDIALDTRQWRAVRLLIAAGALEKCRQMDQMRQLLADMLPNALLGRARLPGLLPSGLQSVLGLVFRQPNSRSTLDGPASEPGTAAGPAQHAGSAAQQPGSLVICLADSVEDVLLHKQKLLQHVANMTGRDVPSAGAVLASNRWDERQAIAACQVDAGELNANQPAAAGAGRIAIARFSDAPQTCIVCFESVHPTALKARLPCGHTTCNTCWKGILRARLGDGDVQHTICPDPDCSMPLPDSAVVQLLSRADLQRFRRLMAQNYVDSNPCIKWCPRPNCGKAVALQVVPGHPDGVADAVANGRALDVACACGHRFCFSCLAAPHEPAHCDWALSWEALVAQSRAEAANQNQHWMHRHTKKCPGCGSNIQKTGGCNHMVCTLCRRQFCWVCGGDWSQHNAETGGYYACNRFSQPGEEDFAAEDGNPAQEHGGPRGFLEGLLQGVTQRAVQFRIGHHMRRYFAQDCDERQLLVAAQWMAALLTASMPEPGQAQPGASSNRADHGPPAECGDMPNAGQHGQHSMEQQRIGGAKKQQPDAQRAEQPGVSPTTAGSAGTAPVTSASHVSSGGAAAGHASMEVASTSGTQRPDQHMHAQAGPCSPAAPAEAAVPAEAAGSRIGLAQLLPTPVSPECAFSRDGGEAPEPVQASLLLPTAFSAGRANAEHPAASTSSSTALAAHAAPERAPRTLGDGPAASVGVISGSSTSAADADAPTAIIAAAPAEPATGSITAAANTAARPDLSTGRAAATTAAPAAMGRGIATDQTAAEERYVYLTRLAEEVVRTRQVLQNSYIAAYYLGYGDQRRQFEEMQGRLETAVEHLALPLVLLPDAATIVAEAAMRPGSELAASLDKLPLPVSDRDTLKRQFFFAAAVEQRSHAIKRLLAGMVGDRERMLQLGRTGKLWNAEAGGSGGPQRAQQRGQPPDQAQLGYGSSLANVAAALASFWADRG